MSPVGANPPQLERVPPLPWCQERSSMRGAVAQIPSVAGGVPLVATKLFAPRPRADLVPRPRLLTRLDTGLDAGRCSLLSAPAGAGKTSLLAAWLAKLDRPVSWLTLDEGDQDTGQVL